jgi:hypothetical protein
MQDGKFMMVAELYKINYHMEPYKTEEEMMQLLKKNGFNRMNFMSIAKRVGYVC